VRERENMVRERGRMWGKDRGIESGRERG